MCRCLVVGDAHDLEVVFRLVQLWLKLGADGDVVAQLAAAFAQSPSHKFLPLMYQMASRLSAARAGPLIASGFQARPSLMPESFGEGCPALSVCTACLAKRSAGSVRQYHLVLRLIYHRHACLTKWSSGFIHTTLWSDTETTSTVSVISRFFTILNFMLPCCTTGVPEAPAAAASSGPPIPQSVPPVRAGQRQPRPPRSQDPAGPGEK